MAQTESNRDVTHICQDFGFCPLADMKFEPKEIDKYTMMYSIASKHQGINILVKVDRNDIAKSF